MSGSSALPKRSSVLAMRAFDLAQLSPADSLFMSATPLQEQKERALRQVLQEEVMSCHLCSGSVLLLLVWGFIMDRLARQKCRDVTHCYVSCLGYKRTKSLFHG